MTIEQFEIEFDNAQTLSTKEELIDALQSELDLSNIEIKEKMREYRAQLNDFKEQLEIEADSIIDKEIENEKYTLFTCIKSIDEYVNGRDYYVFIDDVASQYRKLDVDKISKELAEYVENIKPIIWIISDSGIGTLKRKSVFKGDFSKYFTELVF